MILNKGKETRERRGNARPLLFGEVGGMEVDARQGREREVASKGFDRRGMGEVEREGRDGKVGRRGRKTGERERKRRKRDVDVGGTNEVVVKAERVPSFPWLGSETRWVRAVHHSSPPRGAPEPRPPPRPSLPIVATCSWPLRMERPVRVPVPLRFGFLRHRPPSWGPSIFQPRPGLPFARTASRWTCLLSLPCTDHDGISLAALVTDV